MAVRIVVDAMGGDFAPEVNLKGATAALDRSDDLDVTLVGHEKTLRAEMKRWGIRESARLKLMHAEDAIDMGAPATAIRKQKDSSIYVGLQLLKSKQADAFLSAGNSGAVMAGALLVLGRLQGIERPAIVVKLPTADGFLTLLDAGANVDCRPNHLKDFARMGSLYAELVEGIERPRVGLVSNGTEAHKGNELTRQADELLRRETALNYLGYVEGYDLFKGKTDVAVCDGFVGNVLLKMAEGLADSTFRWFRKELRQDVLGLLGVVMMKKVLRNFKKKFDYQPYGAAPLLGIDGMVLISHGGSTEIAIRNGILTAKRAVEQRFLERFRLTGSEAPTKSKRPRAGKQR